MKVGVITNLAGIDKFIKSELASADASAWMRATGGNTGNVAFVQGVTSVIGDETVPVNWGTSPKWVKKNCRQLVVCCANQLGAHVDLSGWADRLTKFELPVTLIGLGAQADQIGESVELPEGTLRFLRVVNELRPNPDLPNIISRGAFTSSVIREQGYESAPLGCPSQFISKEKGLGQKCLDRASDCRFPRVMVAAGNPGHSSHMLDSILADILQQNNGCYVLQHPKVLFEVACGDYENLSQAQVNRLEKMYKSIGNIADIADWFTAYSIYFADAQNWMKYSARFSFAVGPRYHGVALPIQSGTAGTVITIDSRTEELASTTGVPYKRYDDIRDLDANSLLEYCYWHQGDADTYDQTRERNAEAYIRFLETNNLNASDHLRNLSN